MKVALGVEYNGAHFHGWQKQQNLTTIQSALETTLSKVANEQIHVFCAGRTDAGVHATNQVVHFETRSERNLNAWICGTNSYLPNSVSVRWAKIVDESFHARFSALSRRYQYFIYNSKVRSGLFSQHTTWIFHDLDEEKMNLAAQCLIGEHDFTAFRSADCQARTPNRHVFNVKITRQQELVVIDIIANSFLHHMVRNIVGVLIDIGINKKEIKWCQEILQTKNRTLASKTASPQGLYLTGVRYADSYALPYDFRSPSFFASIL